MTWIKDSLFVALFLSLFVIGTRTQTAQRSVGTDTAAGSSQSAPSNATAEASLNAAMQQLMSASSIEEILQMGVLQMHGHTLTPEDLEATVDNSTGKLMVSSGNGVFGVPAMCSPRETAVDVRDPNLSSSSRLYPTCIRVPRCGGCCGAPDVECVPSYRERQVYNLLEVQYQGSGMTVMDRYPVEIERHVSCECRCSLNQEKCGPTKMFVHSMCACICVNTNIRCDPPTMFSPETCGCVCAERQNCCPGGGPNCFLSFNENTCQCDFDRTLVSNMAGNISLADIEAYQQQQQAIMANGGNGGASSSQSSPGEETEEAGEEASNDQAAAATTPAPTTTTASPTTTTPASPCAGVSCPGYLVPRVTSSGVCQCGPRRGRGSSRRNRNRHRG